jgi:hypothetical protein
MVDQVAIQPIDLLCDNGLEPLEPGESLAQLIDRRIETAETQTT